MENKKYDAIIVGMGPGGIFCAYELVKLHKHKNILLIDQGRSIYERTCPMSKVGKCLHCNPCAITSGFSGAGAFSDGKLLCYHLSDYDNNGSMYLSGSGGDYIMNFLTEKEMKELLDYTDKVYLEFGADTKLEGIDYKEEISKMQAKAKKENLKLIDIPIRHLGTEKAHALYARVQDFLTKENVEMRFLTTCEDIIVENNKVVGIKIKDLKTNNEETLYGENIVMATGRKGASWLSDICNKHNIDKEVGPVDIGIRYELPNSVMEKVNKYMYEGRFVGRPAPYCDTVRTFCQNPGGYVSAEVYDNSLTLCNGHSFKDKKSDNTNLAILVTHHFKEPFNKPIEYGINVAENMNTLSNGNIVVQRLGDIYRGKRTWKEELDNNSVKPTLKTALPGDITFALGYRTMMDILQFIRSVDKVVEGFADPNNLLYAPEIKFYSNRIKVNNDFETSIKNLYSIGECGGLTTGLSKSSASGVKMARILNNKI
jgi:hypothetical protein